MGRTWSVKKLAFLLIILCFVANCIADNQSETVDDLIKTIRENPKDYKAIDKLVRLASKTKRIDFVKPVFNELINSKENSFSGYMGRALSNFMGGDQNMGLKDSLQAIEIAKQNKIDVPAGLYFHMGLFYLKSRIVPSARDYFEKTVTADPKYSEAHFFLAYLKDMQLNLKYRTRKGTVEKNEKYREEIKKIIEHLDKCSETASDDQIDLKIKSLVFAADILCDEKKNSEAIIRYEKAKNADPKKFHTLVDYGEVLSKMNEKEMAEVVWKERIKILGKGSEQGLSALRNIKMNKSKAIDFTNFLPHGKAVDYLSLVYNICKGNETLTETKYNFEHQNINYTLEVSYVPVKDKIQKITLNKKARLIVTNNQSKEVLINESLNVEHFQNHAFVKDIDNNGSLEVISGGFDSPNKLTVKIYQLSNDETKSVEITADCTGPISGIFFCDLDDDDKMEILKVSGNDNWIEIFKYENNKLVSVDKQFKSYFEYYVEKYGKMSKFDMPPHIFVHLNKAKEILKAE